MTTPNYCPLCLSIGRVVELVKWPCPVCGYPSFSGVVKFPDPADGLPLVTQIVEGIQFRGYGRRQKKNGRR
jgi:hypothetical protein